MQTKPGTCDELSVTFSASCPSVLFRIIAVSRRLFRTYDHNKIHNHMTPGHMFRPSVGASDWLSPHGSFQPTESLLERPSFECFFSIIAAMLGSYSDRSIVYKDALHVRLSDHNLYGASSGKSASQKQKIGKNLIKLRNDEKSSPSN